MQVIRYSAKGAVDRLPKHLSKSLIWMSDPTLRLSELE